MVDIGQNYLQACDRAAEQDSAGARDAYVGLLEVLHAQRPKFTDGVPMPQPGGGAMVSVVGGTAVATDTGGGGGALSVRWPAQGGPERECVVWDQFNNGGGDSFCSD
jgi:hypothetical protein